MAKGTSTMVRHALFMMAGTLASRVLGLAREIITAAWFGASGLLDAFNVAFTLANLARQLLAEGALSASFVPVFSRVLSARGREPAEGLARQAFAVLLAAGIAAATGGAALSPLLVKIMAPGFDPVKADLAVRMTRWLFPFLLFVSLGALAMGVLNSMGSFLVPALAPALSNLVYIILVVVLASSWGIWGLVAAVLAGGIFQFLLQWFWALRKGILLLPSKPRRGDPELRTMLTLFLPYAAGLSLNQINPVLSRMLASFLQEGSISVLNYANRVIQLPLGLFVIAISQAVLPQLSRCPAGLTDEFREIMRDALRFALFVVLPVTAATILLSGEMIHLLFVRGAFGEWAWKGTSLSLGMYALGLPGMACSTVVLRGLYARGMARGALWVTSSSVIATALFSLLLMGPFSFGGLALATSIAFTLSGAVGVHILSRSLAMKLEIFTPSWTVKMAVSLSAMTGLILGFQHLFPYPVPASLLLRGGWFLGVFLLGGAAYAAMTRILGFSEWKWITGAFLSRRKKAPSDEEKKEEE